MYRPKIGLVTNMALDAACPDYLVKKVENDHKKACQTLKELDMDVVLGSEGLSRTREEMIAAGRRMINANVEAIVVYVGWWTYASVVVELAMLTDLPILIWTYSETGRINIGLVGGSIVRGSLEEIGRAVGFVHGSFDCKRSRKKIKTWCVGSAAAMRLRGKKLGVAGSRTMGMYTACVDPSQIKKCFGIDIDGWEQSYLLEKAKAISDEKAEEFMDWMKKVYGGFRVKKESAIAQIKMYLALRDLIKENNYAAVAIRCLPEMTSLHTTFCLAHAILNDTEDAFGKKIPCLCGCEGDINGTLTMMMMQNISGQAVMFSDFLIYDEENSMLTLCNCGSHPTDMAQTKKDVVWAPEGLIHFEWKIGSCNPVFVAKPGNVTMARLSRIDGKFVMLIMRGTVKEKPVEALEALNPNQAQAFVKLHATQEDFEANIRNNHIHVTYGDYVDELKILCDTLGIKPIVI